MVMGYQVFLSNGTDFWAAESYDNIKKEVSVTTRCVIFESNETTETLDKQRFTGQTWCTKLWCAALWPSLVVPPYVLCVKSGVWKKIKNANQAINKKSPDPSTENPVYPELSKTEQFLKMANGWKPLVTFSKTLYFSCLVRLWIRPLYTKP